MTIGDSFSEGVGDDRPDGSVRGWADLTALGWAAALGEPIEYANLAIRGKKIAQIVDEQLEPALALGPTHLTFNGGGNDMLRPVTKISDIADAFSLVLHRCDEEGVQLVLLTGPNPSGQLPLGSVIQRRGDAMSAAVLERIVDRPDVIRALNWPDQELFDPSYWSQDRLHMNARGHHRVAARALEAVGVVPPPEWWSPPATPGVAEAHLSRGAHARQYVGPWIKRRITRTSSGDGRPPKFGEFVQVEPQPLTGT